MKKNKNRIYKIGDIFFADYRKIDSSNPLWGYAILSVLDDKKTINLINLNGGNRWYKSIRVKSCQNITIKDLLRFDVEFRKNGYK